MLPPKILIVDDEKNIRKTLGLVLEGEGYEVESADSAERGLKHLESEGADLMILDVKLPGMSGIDMLRKVRSDKSDTNEIPIIMISGHASLSEAVDAVKHGATDFFEKPLDRNAILIRVANCLKQHRLANEVKVLRAAAGVHQELVGKTEVIEKLFGEINKVAPTNGRVLITGESGTGKELIARAIHRTSTRVGGPFIKVNCAAIPSELIESELFGYEKGAFTGAHGRKAGQFELAEGGTLFLDEIGDMSLDAQAKVLRVLQSGEISRVGGERTINVDVRVLAATNRNLEDAVAGGGFREDLYFRLNVLPIKAPPLRDRPEDIPLLLDTFITQFCKENGYRKKEMDRRVLSCLTAYKWPGNVRELKNLAERLMIMSGERITVDDLPDQISGEKPNAAIVPKFKGERPTLREFRDTLEREFIIDTLEENEWNISRSSNILGIERTNLHKKLKALNISRGNR